MSLPFLRAEFMKNNGAASVDPNVNDLYLKSLSRCVPITTGDMRKGDGRRASET